MTKGLILAVLLVGFASSAGAQPAREGMSAQSDERVAPDAADPPAVADAPHVRLDLRHSDDWLARVASDREGRRFVAAPTFRIAPRGLAVRSGPPMAGPRTRPSRTFVPVPILGWQTYSSLVTPRGFVAVNPSIVVGRRLTWMPELARPGRTLGVAIQVRMWLDRPASVTAPPPPPQTSARILSAVRAMLDRR